MLRNTDELLAFWDKFGTYTWEAMEIELGHPIYDNKPNLERLGLRKGPSRKGSCYIKQVDGTMKRAYFCNAGKLYSYEEEDCRAWVAQYKAEKEVSAHRNRLLKAITKKYAQLSTEELEKIVEEWE